MKQKRLLILLILLAASFYSAWAQLSSYNFSVSSSTYTAISGGTSLGNTSTDDHYFVDPAVPSGSTTTKTGVGFPIGFNFTFDGQTFDRVGINANGWISLGQSSLSPAVNMNTSSAYSPISTTTSISPDVLVSRIAALGRDLQAQTGAELRIETIGTAPNRECVIQWTNYRKYNATGDSYNFQIRLQENGNKIQVVYGTMTNNATSTTVQVGLRGAPSSSATNYNNLSSTTSWSSPSAGTSASATMTLSSTVYPSSGTTYTWWPNLSNQTITSSTTTQITGSVPQGAIDWPVIVLQIVADGSNNPLTVNTINFTTTGTTNTADLLNAKVYYTTTSSFSTANQFGTTIANPSGSLIFSGSQQLVNGNNYFWLAYDISASATDGNIADATCTQFTTTEPQTYVPTITNPTGSLTIRAPLNGTYTIDQSNPTNVPGGTNYNNWDDALSDLNSLGHSGPVTFNVAAGQTWSKTISGSNYAYFVMEYIGSAASPVVFQKSGSGANPKLVITGTSAINDIGMFLYGCDYVTFNGIDIEDAGTSSSNYLDRGYYLQGPADDNCDHVSIQNCTIDLNKNNTSAYGIYAYSNAPTSTSNANNNLSIQNNTVTDAYYGIYLSGNSTYRDQNNTISGNTITFLGNNLSGSVYGIYAYYQSNPDINTNTINNLTSSSFIYGIYVNYNDGASGVVNGNTISNLTGSSTSTVYGIYGYSASTATTTFSSNTIHTLTNAGAIYGLYVGAGTTNNIFGNSIYNVLYNGSSSYIAYGLSSSGGTTNNIYNNFIYDIKAPASTGTPGVRAMNFTGGTTANVYHNTVYLNYTSTSASNQSAALYVTTSPTTLNLQNNIFVNNVDVTTGTRAVAFYKSTTSLTNLPNSNNNNLFYAGTPGTKNLIYYDGTNSYQTLGAMQTALAPRESASVTENPPFVSSTSPYDLHLSGSSVAESGGTSTTGVSIDFDGDTRQGFPGYSGTGLSPDIGADEFSGTNPNWAAIDLGATALVAPAATGCYGAAETVTVTIKNYGTSTLDFSVNNATVTTDVTG
ncbi:MAG: BNR-repeat neuraminidase N-terminal domain-containing protein, partial [Bacteroidales bacterium]